MHRALPRVQPDILRPADQGTHRLMLSGFEFTCEDGVHSAGGGREARLARLEVTAECDELRRKAEATGWTLIETARSQANNILEEVQAERDAWRREQLLIGPGCAAQHWWLPDHYAPGDATRVEVCLFRFFEALVSGPRVTLYIAGVA